MIVVDPHGELIKTVVSLLPERRLQDVIYLSLEDACDFPFGLSLFECPEPRSIGAMAQAASLLSHCFEKIFLTGVEHAPRLMMVLRAVTRMLLENPGTTFAEIGLLFSDDTVRAKMVANLTNPEIVAFWEGYTRLAQRGKDELIASTLNKVQAFLDEPMIRNIVGQSKSTIDLRRSIDEGRILLIQLSPRFEEASRLLGACLLAKLLMAAFSRSETPEEQRRPCMLFVDEFSRYAYADMAVFIHEARKWKIAPTLALQTLAQLDEANRAAALACGNLMVFRVSGLDAPVLAKNFDASPAPIVIGEEAVRAPVADIVTHLVRRGHDDPRVARFAQTYLSNLERYLHKPAIPHEPQYSAYYNCFDGVINLTERHVVWGREYLNETLYKAMLEKRSDLQLPTLALYILAVAQQDGREYILSNWVTKSFHDFKAFEPGAEQFGKPSFTTPFTSQAYLSQVEKGWGKKYLWMAEEIVSMLKELRYCMDALARECLMVDSGKVQPRYQQRTYADMAGQIQNELSQLPNFHARVRFLSSGEHVLKTKPLSPLISGDELSARFTRIKRRMWEEGYTRFYKEIEKDIRERAERLKTPIPEGRRRRSSAEDPPPTSA